MNPPRVASPLRIVRRGPANLAAPTNPPAIVRASALGFAGAREEDRLHWLGAFRRLLDALDAPLQVVIQSRPGRGAETASTATATTAATPAATAATAPGPPPLTDHTALRAADVEFAERLARSDSSIQRDVLLVAQKDDAVRVHDLLRDLGVSAAEHPTPDPPCGEEQRDAFLDVHGWHRTWFLNRFPGIELEPAWLIDLLPNCVRADLAWNAVPLPTAWMIQHLQRRLAGLRATHLAGAGSDVHVDGALPAAEKLQRSLAASEERAFRVSLYLTISASTQADLTAAATRVEQAARGVLATIQPLTFEMAAGRISTLPLGHDPLARHHVLDTSALATLFPWRDAELRHERGLVLGSSRAAGTPVMIDPFDQRLYANANIGVFGHSGAGKTFLLSSLALGAYASGSQVFVLDPEHEYGGLAKALGGEDVQLALGSGHALNVLPVLTNDDQNQPDESALGPAVADAVDLVAMLAGALDEAERAAVEHATRSAYAGEPEPLLKHVAQRLAPGRTKAVLDRWVEGSLGAMFSRPTNVNLDADFVVFGMREMRDELVAPVHFLLAEALWSRIKGRGRRRLLLIDELGLLFEDPILRRFVVALARRIRKYDGSLAFATQNPGDLLASEAGAVVATNPSIHFFGAARPGEAARLQHAFQLSPAQRALVETARRGEFLLAAGPERLPLRVIAPDWQAQLVDRARREPTGSRAPP